jgi:exosome complex RNA-binding protein Rrp4
LHTRNPKYGKLEPGVLIDVPHKLIKKQKHHFITISAPWSPQAAVGIVLGNNGNIWLSGLSRSAKESEKSEAERSSNLKPPESISSETMKTISVLYNLLKILSWEGL